jgi:hypothetical protein
MGNMSTSSRKTKVLWLADVAGWAYDSIARNVARRTPRYEHVVSYAMTCQGGKLGLRRQIAEADVIVSMFVAYTGIVPEEQRHKVVTMVTGFRPFEVTP